jgi:hypothetical protein
MRRHHLMSFACVGVGLTLAACGEGDVAPASQTDSSAANRAGPVGTASIAGLVRLVGTAPLNPPIDMRGEPQCRGVYHSSPHQLRVVVNPNRTLANVFVYVKQGLPPGASYQAPVEPVTLDQRGCQYHPRVVGIMVDQPLEIRSADPVLHQIKAVGTAGELFHVDQPAAGRKTTDTLSHPHVMVRLSCAVHSWMRGYVGILPHPFFATTDDRGRYTIDRLPRGTYTIESWHEHYGTRSATVTVAGDSTTRLDIRYHAQGADAGDF